MIISEQPVQSVENNRGREVVRLACPLVPPQHGQFAQRPGSLRQNLGQHRDVAQAQVQPLSRQWMHDMRGIGHQCKTRPRIRIGMHQAQGKGCTRARQRACPQDRRGCPLELLREFLRRQVTQALRVRSGHRPDDGTAPIRQRQEGQRTSGQESLPGRIGMGSSGGHMGHHGRLMIVMPVGSDAGQGAHLRAGAIGADHQCRAERPAVGKADPGRALIERKARHPGLGQHHACTTCGRDRRCAQMLAIDDVAQIGLCDIGGIERKDPRAIGGICCIPHPHALVGMAPRWRDQLPGSNGFEQALRIAAQGEYPQIPVRIGCRRGAKPVGQERNASGACHPAMRKQGSGACAGRPGTDHRHIEVHAHASGTPRARREDRAVPEAIPASADFAGGRRSNASSPALRRMPSGPNG